MLNDCKESLIQCSYKHKEKSSPIDEVAAILRKVTNILSTTHLYSVICLKFI